MIYDKIGNVETYTGISEDILLGLKWLRDVSPDVENGVHVISPRVKAIISEYNTKVVNENGFEAHRECVDIQYLVEGEEIIRCTPLEYLKETIPYNKDRDIAFYRAKKNRSQELFLGNGYFAILFPQDGHMPQLCLNESKTVKKVVIKIKL